MLYFIYLAILFSIIFICISVLFEKLKGIIQYKMHIEKLHRKKLEKRKEEHKRFLNIIETTKDFK